jgi:hypothetical protein
VLILAEAFEFLIDERGPVIFVWPFSFGKGLFIYKNIKIKE